MTRSLSYHATPTGIIWRVNGRCVDNLGTARPVVTLRFGSEISYPRSPRPAPKFVRVRGPTRVKHP